VTHSNSLMLGVTVDGSPAVDCARRWGHARDGSSQNVRLVTRGRTSSCKAGTTDAR
jgi:hypothetical protein